MSLSIVTNEDNMAMMARYPDKFFDVAVLDPPYGIGENWKKDKHSSFYKHNSSYKNDGVPGPEYFSEVSRVSKNQIIWGANYFTRYLPERNSWIVWNKKRSYPSCHMSEGELAWTSFSIPLRIVDVQWNGFHTNEPRSGVHPHEKPTALYRWLLENYAQPGDKILDTHLGSQSSRIAAYELGFDFWGCERDPHYYAKGCKRYQQHINQLTIFSSKL